MKHKLKKFEKIQRKISKQICNKSNFYNKSYTERRDILGIKTLEVRHKYSILKQLYECLNNCPSIPSNWVSKFEFNTNLRNGKLLLRPKTRNNFTDKNLFMYSIELFNSLPKNIRNEIHCKTFLTKCLDFL